MAGSLNNSSSLFLLKRKKKVFTKDICCHCQDSYLDICRVLSLRCMFLAWRLMFKMLATMSDAGVTRF